MPLAFLLIWKDFHLHFLTIIFNYFKLPSRSLENGLFYYYIFVITAIQCNMYWLPTRLGLPPTLHTD